VFSSCVWDCLGFGPFPFFGESKNDYLTFMPRMPNFIFKNSLGSSVTMSRCRLPRAWLKCQMSHKNVNLVLSLVIVIKSVRTDVVKAPTSRVKFGIKPGSNKHTTARPSQRTRGSGPLQRATCLDREEWKMELFPRKQRVCTGAPKRKRERRVMWRVCSL
jgi:hypothetical protein